MTEEALLRAMEQRTLDDPETKANADAGVHDGSRRK
jgi:hypothetical protein